MTIGGRKLFFLRENGRFPAGTLFELADADRLVIPDGGDGRGFTAERGEVVECPPFAENVPPGQCPVMITSFSVGPASELEFEQNLHHQIIGLPFAVDSVIVTDRVTGAEADSYYPSGGVNFDLHVGHLRPGFYLAAITGKDGAAELTFIKFFPRSLCERYHALAAERSRGHAARLPGPANEGRSTSHASSTRPWSSRPSGAKILESRSITGSGTSIPD